MVDTWRLFIALELPSELVASLEEVQAQLIRQTPPRTVRWVQPGSIHLTLKFLGDSPVSQRISLEDALRRATNEHIPFRITAGGLGCFPNTNRPRVVWIGIRETANTLTALRDSVERFVAPLGYPTENRPFSPHLTLGRVNRDASHAAIQKLGNLIAGISLGDLYTWTVTEVSLMRSELRPDGAVYTALHHAPLQPNA
mgnify:CR=1 FL=1